MLKRLLISVSIFLMSASFAMEQRAGSTSQNTRKLSPAPEIQISNQDEGTISGKITFKGAAPKRLRIDISDDPVCQQINPNLMTEDWVVQAGALANVFVYIKDGDLADGRKVGDLNFKVTTTAVVLDQRGCHYVPRVLGVQAGQTLKVVNSDPTPHNVHPVPRTNEEWNLSQSKGGPPIEKRFIDTEVMIPVKDNRHPWMKAYIGVLKHPYYTVSKMDGSFEIRGVPPGTYTIAAWHEGGAFGVEKTMQVVVATKRIVTANISFGPSDVVTGRPLFLQTMPDTELKKGEWQFMDAAEGDLLYVNLATIAATTQHTLTAWFKNVPTDSPEGQASRQTSLDVLDALRVNRSAAFSYSLTRAEFDCAHRKIRDLLETRYYDQQGNLLYSDEASNYNEADRSRFMQWESVVTGSVGEEQLNFVCKRRH